MRMDEYLEQLWDQLLSGEADKITSAYASLSQDEQKVVLEHLSRMANEPGWHPQQQRSARAAIEALIKPPKV